jgi:hypothetical protein
MVLRRWLAKGEVQLHRVSTAQWKCLWRMPSGRTQRSAGVEESSNCTFLQRQQDSGFRLPASMRSFQIDRSRLGAFSAECSWSGPLPDRLLPSLGTSASSEVP